MEHVLKRAAFPSVLRPTTVTLQWVAVIFGYLFTWHALYVLRGEHQVFAEMREAFLTRGDPDFALQTRYTSKVPHALRRERQSRNSSRLKVLNSCVVFVGDRIRCRF